MFSWFRKKPDPAEDQQEFVTQYELLYPKLQDPDYALYNHKYDQDDVWLMPDTRYDQQDPRFYGRTSEQREFNESEEEWFYRTMRSTAVRQREENQQLLSSVVRQPWMSDADYTKALEAAIAADGELYWLQRQAQEALQSKEEADDRRTQEVVDALDRLGDKIDENSLLHQVKTLAGEHPFLTGFLATELYHRTRDE